MNTQILPLLKRPPLRLGESLHSFLIRLAESNSYQPSSILLDIITGTSYPKRDIELSSNILYFERIVTLTGSDICKLYKSTPHSFTKVFALVEDQLDYLKFPEIPPLPLLLKGLAHEYLRPSTKGQFCPFCLQSNAYHRLIWTSLACAVCLQHQCVLVNTCHRCGKEVSITDITSAYCTHCYADLREAPTISVKDDPFGLFTQTVIQSWITEDCTPTSTSYALAKQPPRALYRIVEGLRSCLALVSQDWSLFHYVDVLYSPRKSSKSTSSKPAPYYSYCLYATAFKGIIDWPNGFYTFLTAYISANKENRPVSLKNAHGVRAKLDLLYESCLKKKWRFPSLEFVQKAFNKYLVNNHTSLSTISYLHRYKEELSVMHGLEYMNLNEAQRELKIDHSKLRIFITTGQLKTYTEGTSRVVLLKREEVMALHAKWGQVISSKEAMGYLGVSSRFLQELVQTGLLSRSGSKSSLQMFLAQDIANFLERVMKKVLESPTEQAEKGKDFFSLHVTCSKTARVGVRKASILLHIIEGKIRAYHPAYQERQLSTLMFARMDVEKYIEGIKAEKGWIDRLEAAKLLKVHEQCISYWIRADLLSYVSSPCIPYFYRDAIEQFGRDYVLSSAEVCSVLGTHRTAVQTLVHQGRLQTVGGLCRRGYPPYVFSREYLLRWREKWIGRYEILQRYNVNPQMITRWIEEGSLVSLGDKTQRPQYFLRQSVLGLIRR